MKILITGGLGYIGSHLAVKLLQKKYDITIIDNLENSKIDIIKKIKKITGKGVKFYKIDLLDKKKLSSLFKTNKFDTVFHLAGLKSVKESETNPEKYLQGNITTSINLLNVMIKFNVRKIVYSSSATVYGDQKENIYHEGMKTNPTNFYGFTKKTIEDFLIELNKKKMMKYVILRYFNPAGCHESGLLGDEPNGIANNLFPYILQLIKGKHKKLKIYGNKFKTKDGTGARDYIHIDDLVDAHVKSLKIIKKKKSEILNIGTGKAYTVLEIVKTFQNCLNYNIKYEYFKKRKGDLAIYFNNIKKSKKILNWVAKKNLEDMCSSIYKYGNK